MVTLGGFLNAGLALEDPVTVWLGSVDLGDAGLLLVALLLAVWGAAALKARTPGKWTLGRWTQGKPGS